MHMINYRVKGLLEWPIRENKAWESAQDILEYKLTYIC